MVTYHDSGVDIKLGDDVSRILYEAAKKTWTRKGLGKVIVPNDDFSGVRAIDVSRLPEGTMMNMGFDGVGTKVEIAERLDDHSTMAFDLFAMVCDDAVMKGAEPVLVGSILDVNKLSIQGVKQLADGYVKAAIEAGVAVVNGEVAELGNRVNGFGNFSYNWGAACVWFGNKDKMFTGKEIKVGDSIVAFKENGFRSNGLSLLRKVMENHWDTNSLRQALVPSKIYCKAVVNIFGGIDKEPKAELHGVAHITGGGIPGKLGRVLRQSGFGAELNDLFEPCSLMKKAIELGEVPLQEAYQTWNMGNGMLVITPEPDKVIEIASNHGITSKVCGKIIDENQIKINELKWKLH